MGEQNQPNAQGTQWAFLGSANDSYYLPGHEYIAGVGIDGIHYIPVPTPQWINHQQTPQNYYQFLAENVVSEVPVDASAEASGFRLFNGSTDMIAQEQIRYPPPYYEGVPLNCLISSEHQQTWESNGAVRHASVPYYGTSAAGSSDPSKSSKKLKAVLADQRRRMRIAERIEALGELISCSKKVGRASLMDEIIDHVKYLQSKIKDLSRSRLGGESSSIPFVFLEGCGHYILDEQLAEQPLEQTLGKLLEVNPSMVTQLLENKGLYVMPMALAEGLHPHE